MKVPLTAAAILGLAVAPGAGHAQDKAKEDAAVLFKETAKTSIFDFDYGPPTSPAMKLLGQDPDKTPTSTSLTRFVVALPSLYGTEGNQSVAIDLAPAAVVQRASEQTYVRYVGGGWGYRMAYRTRVGVSALNGKADDDPDKAVRSRLALGFSASLLDSADPIMTGLEGDGSTVLSRCLTPVEADARAVRETPNPEADALGERIIAIQAARRALARGQSYPGAEDLLGPIPGVDGDGPVRTAPRQPAPDPQTAADLALFRQTLDDPAATPREKAMARFILQTMAPAARPAAGDAPMDAAPAESGTLAERLAAREAELRTRLDKALDADDLINKRLKAIKFPDRVRRCAELANRVARFSDDFDVGLGVLARGEPGKLESLKGDGRVLWAAYKRPLVRWDTPDLSSPDPLEPLPQKALMVAVSSRFSWKERVATGDKTTPEFSADTRDVWVGLEYLSPRFRFAGQYGWVDFEAREAAGQAFEGSGERYLVSSQFQVGGEKSAVWLGLSYGNGYGTLSRLKDHAALVTLYFTPPKADSIVD